MANTARLKRTELATFYVYVVFLACLLPHLCVRTAIRMHGESVLRMHLFHYSMTLVFLSSSLNPLIYSWKMRDIRQAVMSKLNSDQGPLYKMASAKGLHLTLVVSCVFNAFLCFTSILLNIITIQALRKTSSLPKTLKTLLLSLAVSDLGVGLLVQPLYVAILLMEIDQNTNSTAYNSKKIFVTASHFGVFALTVDRFLAIHLHLRYQELVTHKRVVAVVISVWVLSASISIPRGLSQDPFIMPAVIIVVCIITTGLLYCKIYAAMRHQTNQMQAQVQQVQQATQNEDMANAARLKKSSLATFYIYLVYLACYLPIACVVLAKVNSKTALYFTSATLVYLNSSLNPLIYCWKMRHIRQTVMNILRNIFAIGQH
ncbi:unnamed protein product [Porites evermanni]|uniref:G-protein coupled receptors family 1 profile domain-containing protein n=1 Tax=Porites evermanni TaxID=104178 RepID=A0ABN8M8F9_9CNID|nr:unnamed protein product [Porites evermanni]